MNNQNNFKSYKKPILSILLIAIIGFLIVLWITVFYPYMHDNLEVYQIFLIFYILIISFWITLFVAIFGFNIKAFKSILISSMLSSLIDIFFFPNISLNGEVIESGYTGSESAIDYCIGYYMNSFGIYGFFVFVFVYLLFPILILLLMLLVWNPRLFNKRLKEST